MVKLLRRVLYALSVSRNKMVKHPTHCKVLNTAALQQAKCRNISNVFAVAHIIHTHTHTHTHTTHTYIHTHSLSLPPPQLLLQNSEPQQKHASK